MSRKKLLTVVITSMLCGCSAHQSYSVFNSKDGETWDPNPIQANVSRDIAIRQLDGSCVMRLWGLQHHSVKIVNTSNGSQEIYDCSDVYEKRIKNSESQPSKKKGTKETKKLW